MRRKEERSKQGQTNKQHSTPTFPTSGDTLCMYIHVHHVVGLRVVHIHVVICKPLPTLLYIIL